MPGSAEVIVDWEATHHALETLTQRAKGLKKVEQRVRVDVERDRSRCIA